LRSLLHTAHSERDFSHITDTILLHVYYYTNSMDSVFLLYSTQTTTETIAAPTEHSQCWCQVTNIGWCPSCDSCRLHRSQ